MKRVEGNMLIVGTPPAHTPWQAARRNQRRAALLAPRPSARPGVFLFKSHQEADQWMIEKQVAASLKRRT